MKEKIKKIKLGITKTDSKEIPVRAADFIFVDILNDIIGEDTGKIIEEITSSENLRKYFEENSAKVIVGNILMHRYVHLRT